MHLMSKGLSEVTDECFAHIASADERYGPFTSTHEALGVLIEELKELTDAIHANAIESVREEAIDIAAVAMRLAYCCRGNDEFRKRSVK